MRSWLPTALAVLAAAILQVGLAPNIAIGDVAPNLVLLVVVTLALTRGPSRGCVAGFAAGLVLDLIGSGPVGLWALVLCVVGYAAGMLEANLFAHGWLLPVTVVFIAALTAEIGYWVVLAVVGQGVGFGGMLTGVALPGALYDTALAVLIYPWLARILRTEPSVAMVDRLR